MLIVLIKQVIFLQLVRIIQSERAIIVSIQSKNSLHGSFKVNSLRSFKVKQLFCCFFFFFFISFYLYSWLLMSFNIRTYFLNSLTSSSDTETPSTSGSRNTDKNILRYTV